ncbi:hypothetical protein D8824_08055 [Streptococcus intermedius]|uniref:DUF1310 family protein n=1 Tax=Streptococcus intermedius TaxID=1338 RepID=UPI00023297DF|nr:DUF1310 family protein [Streptococcus intermedius]EHG12127.1 hypothetical protein HMPREF9177_01125 [Streptococcus intermedius F0413]PMR66780.1 DUF1310 domain-containing protein [Streptococcus intermedius]QKH77124.1 DUF1310 family protein [Streptococcus intermedius]RSJ09587.1 hypothetical protein D8833_08225 [Streptococcus intermedius]RSJ15556.1 hypothetical protein D8831_08355 [Streptococcus intermedius]
MRKKKLIWILVSILALIGIVIGGFTMHQHQEKQKMIQIATSKEAKKVYEKKIKKEDSKAFTSTAIIKSYKIDEDSLEYNPMGGLMVTIIINGNNKLSIDFNLIDNGDGTYHSAYYGISAKLGDLLGYK